MTRKRRGRRRVIDGIQTPGPVETVIKAIILVICCALVVLPFVGVISTSIATPEQVTEAGGFVLFPTGVSWDAYRMIFSGGVVTRSLGVTILITVIGTTLSLVLTACLGWALSRRGTFGNRPLLLIVLISLLFGPGLIPSYLVVQSLGLLDTLWALIIPGCVSGFNVVVVRSFFVQLPQEILDSAKVDGAGEFQLFTRIGIPLSKAVFAVIGLFYGVGYWNQFFSALLYLNDNSKWPLHGAAHLRGPGDPAGQRGHRPGHRVPATADLLADGDPHGLRAAGPDRLPVPPTPLRQGHAHRRRQGLISPPSVDGRSACSSADRPSPPPHPTSRSKEIHS
jgi:multiple sugar transport system permease protein/putative aldouronate transport system permease protein